MCIAEAEEEAKKQRVNWQPWDIRTLWNLVEFWTGLAKLRSNEVNCFYMIRETDMTEKLIKLAMK